MARLNLLFFLAFVTIISFIACRHHDVKPHGSTWLDYRVWGDEEGGMVTVRLQFRDTDKEGSTFLLEAPAQVTLDGKELPADSTPMNGFYYELTLPVEEFAGKHTIVYTDSAGRQFTEPFDFTPISLKTLVKDTLTRGELVFELMGLKDTDRVRVLLSDTVAFSEGITRIDTVQNGRVIITRDQLEGLASGPVHIELYKEGEKKIMDGDREKGRISFSYWLTRGFELKDNP